ncbi:MAG: hypothetical protein HY906_18720 [Deltaproteobacteria bacterium]|nr:hypothetical protein [Deltaproteobacteria bacterium]
MLAMLVAASAPARAELVPTDCDARARLAWQLLQQGDLDGAQRALRGGRCPRPGPEEGRWLVLRAALLQARSFDAAARGALARFAARAEAFPEDVALWQHLRRQPDPAGDAPLGLRLDLLGGWTSNALAGLPLDPSAPGPRSPFARADLAGRLLLPRRGLWQPSLEGLLSGFALADRESQRFTSGQMLARPGVLLGRDTRVLLAYKLDLYLMNQKGAVLYYQAHRAEAEVQWRRLLAFAAVGWRQFHDADRTRAELDGGVGWTFAPGRRLRLILVGSLRYQLADDVAYDVAGGTALVNGRVALGRGLVLQVGGTVGYDHYVSSGEQRGLELFGLVGKRRDLLSTATATLWSPSWRGLRLGVGYDYARRDSNADAPRSFDYQEHRGAVRLRWTADFDPWAPRATAPPGHVPLDYGIGSRGATMDEERIQDLLRQDEADRRSGCGCGR